MIPLTGPVILRESSDLRRLVQTLYPWASRFVIKVNWSSWSPGAFTDPTALDWVLGALAGEKLVVEGHSFGRRRLPPPEGSAEHRDWFRSQEREFLVATGIEDTLSKHGARYVNVSEEIWGGRVVPPCEVEALVSVQFGSPTFTEVLGFLPRVLCKDRERTLFIDLARIKSSRDGKQWSLLLKNLFGLIPDIQRDRYHPRLPEAIMDIARVYLAAFPVLGICESLEHRVVYGSGGQYSAGWSRYDLEDGQGYVAAGSGLLELELKVAEHLGLCLEQRALIKLAGQVFGDRNC